MVDLDPTPAAWDPRRGVFIVRMTPELRMDLQGKRPGDLRHPRLLQLARALTRAARWAERRAFW